MYFVVWWVLFAYSSFDHFPKLINYMKYKEEMAKIINYL